MIVDRHVDFAWVVLRYYGLFCDVNLFLKSNNERVFGGEELEYSQVEPVHLFGFDFEELLEESTDFLLHFG